MRVFAAAFRLQLQIVRSDPSFLMPLATVPIFTVIFLAIVEHAGRDDLTGYALMAPVLIALWGLSLFVSGEIVEDDRWQGVLEAVIAAPASVGATVVARVLAVTTLALFAFVEVWLVARVLFDTPIVVHHPVLFTLTAVATAVAMAGTAVIMAALFVLARSARTFQNSLSWPFYVLGGIFVPVSLLPGWVQPITKIVFLSWSADLLRESLEPSAVSGVAPRLAVVLALGAAGFALGQLLLYRILRRVRADGTLAVV